MVNTSASENPTMPVFQTRAALAAALLLLPVPAVAQSGRTRPDEKRDTETRIERVPGGMSIVFGGGNRAVLGVTLGASSRADTNGVRVDDVQANGPAARAGLKAGDRITEINGISLRVSPVDAEDPALRGLAERRLTRTLAKAKPGDDVELRVQSGGSARTVTVKTVSAADLDGSRRISSVATATGQDSDRAAIGLSIGGAGNLRDTLGLFVSSVVTDGPADKAGVIEGDRIVSINGVDVRVPREDIEDMGAVTARANRFIREVEKVSPGGTISLRVYTGGRTRDVSVRAVRRSELPRQSFRMSIGDGGMRVSLPRTPSAGGATVFPRGDFLQLSPGRVRIDRDGVEIDGEAVERAMDAVRRRMQELGRDFRFEFDGDRVLRNGGTIYRTTPRRTIDTTIPM